MECYYLSPFKGERPAPAPLHRLGEDRPWTDAAELGLLAKVFTQDTFNLPNVQRGLLAAQFDEVVLARYQETKLRHFHQLLKRYISGSDAWVGGTGTMVRRIGGAGIRLTCMALFVASWVSGCGRIQRHDAGDSA